ncbi:hypothetical protein [Nocardioides sp. LS1]|uniref:hypothetical protein n=1 Tax=Nocardioides sp. LS1 TaxID=1027620 RepID=UPI000F623357|nr:hypothetical protein [Nocardioides sp. LS1]GCD88709.1 hypothetical protein NLS1_07150 [Nocardioides sp. LS1]
MSELDLLRGLGDELVPPDFDALVTTARRRTRRTATTTVVAAAAALALVAGATFLALSDDDGRPTPVGPPKIITHPLTYAEGAIIHYGDQDVTAASAVVELDVTDDGVLARLDDGGIWFTDGTDLEQVGTLGQPTPAFTEMPQGPPNVPPGFVVSPNTGSQAAWFEFPEPGKPELVVFDTHTGEESLRTPVDVGRAGYAVLAAVTDTSAYWYTSHEPDSLGEYDVLVPDARIDLATGVQGPDDTHQFTAETQVQNTPRTMMVSHAQGNEPVRYAVSDGIFWQFGVGKHKVEPAGAQPLDARDGGTSAPFTFTPPPGQPESGVDWLTQWLDDDTVVIVANAHGQDDLIECHVSTRACDLALEVPEAAVMPEIG